MRRTNSVRIFAQNGPPTRRNAPGRARKEKAKVSAVAGVDATYVQLLAQVPDWDQTTKHRIMHQWKQAAEKSKSVTA